MNVILARTAPSRELPTPTLLVRSKVPPFVHSVKSATINISSENQTQLPTCIPVGTFMPKSALLRPLLRQQTFWLSYIRNQQFTHQPPALDTIIQLLSPLLLVAWFVPVLKAKRTTGRTRRSNVHIQSHTRVLRFQNSENFRQKLLSFLIEQVNLPANSNVWNVFLLTHALKGTTLFTVEFHHKKLHRSTS